MNIIIYSTPSCSYCKLAKKYFTDKNINFTEYNVVSDLSKIEEMQEKSGQLGVPVIDIDGTIIIGFNKIEIEKVLSVK